MTEVKAATKKGQAIQSDLERKGYGSIWQAYGKPSEEKVSAYEAIERRAWNTEGYNHDLKICGRGSFNFSTVYSYTESDGTLCIVKDTKDYTYLVRVLDNVADTINSVIDSVTSLF